MSIISSNLKHIRKIHNLTQEQFAEKLGIKRSLLGAYEEGRADPRLNNLLNIANVFNVSVDEIISKDLRNHEPASPSRAPGNANQPLRVLSITVDRQNIENIELVPQKAAAGYLNGYADPEYLEQLPKFQLPMLPAIGTYRAFEISGDSMLPLQSGTIVIGKYLDDWQNLQSSKTYILVSQKEGVVYKRIYFQNDSEVLKLVSDNQSYEPYEISLSEVMEIWEAKAFISLSFPHPDGMGEMSLEKLKNIVLELQQEIIKLKK
ncbi:MAG: LexA family transcriptional regulator [Bacteroidota bacterium]|jgi:transcriptional regulator with XRE-family HTH domain|nr:LexA family transcriptional regulator [Bacteroidota bacterium]